MNHRSFVTIFMLLGLNAPISAKQTITVEPGSIVAWQGKKDAGCTLGDKAWNSIDGVCYYPIDLLASEGQQSIGRTEGRRTKNQDVVIGSYPYETQRITLQDDSKVTLSDADLERVGKENTEIQALWTLQTPKMFDLPLGLPLASPSAGGRFGARRIINEQPRNPHSGVDYSAPTGTAVLSVADGTVVLTGDHFFAGNSVFVDHGDGLISMYFHMNSILVAQGQVIKRGEQLGEVGATGRATGAHLHFGIRWHGARVNPEYLFQPQNIPQL